MQFCRLGAKGERHAALVLIEKRYKAARAKGGECLCSNLDVCRGTEGECLVQEGVEDRDLVGGDGSGVGAEEAAAEGRAGDRDSDSGGHCRRAGGSGVVDGVEWSG